MKEIILALVKECHTACDVGLHVVQFHLKRRSAWGLKLQDWAGVLGWLAFRRPLLKWEQGPMMGKSLFVSACLIDGRAFTCRHVRVTLGESCSTQFTPFWWNCSLRRLWQHPSIVCGIHISIPLHACTEWDKARPSFFLPSFSPTPPSPSQVFDVNLNDLIGISDLDIFSSVGKAAAHDVVLPFSIRDGQLSVEGETSDFDGTLSVEFAKVTNWSSGMVRPRSP